MAARVPPRNAVPTEADADQIAVDIRAPAADPGSPATLDHWVRGPLVVLDAERGTVTTECGDRAAGAAASWGLALADASKPDPTCLVQVDRIFCEQRGRVAGDRSLGFYFARAGGWVLTGIVVSRVGREVAPEQIDQFGEMSASAHCPAY